MEVALTHRLTHPERTVVIHLSQPPHRLRRYLLGRNAIGNAGDVDQDVDPAEVAVNLLHSRAHGRLVGHVAAIGDCSAAQGRDLPYCLRTAIPIKVNGRDFCPVSRQADCRRPTQAPCSAHDHGDLLQQIKEILLQVVLQVQRNP